MTHNSKSSHFLDIRFHSNLVNLQEKKQYQVFIEKEVLTFIKSDGVVKLLGSFRDN